MIATDVALRARRVVADAEALLAHDPRDHTLLEQRLGQLISIVGELIAQIDELNRLLFAAECELHYAGEADAALADAERGAAPAWLADLQQARPQSRPPFPGLPKE